MGRKIEGRIKRKIKIQAPEIFLRQELGSCRDKLLATSH